MFTSFLNQPSNWYIFLNQPVWKESMEWLKNNASISKDGLYLLNNKIPNWYCNVHTYFTKPRFDCIWENHRKTIDIQYIINGREYIEWFPASKFETPDSYNVENDREEFTKKMLGSTTILMTEGQFVIFLPGDAHRPMICHHKSELIRKVVVKIPEEILGKGKFKR